MVQSTFIKPNHYRTHTCGELTIDQADVTVTLSGWVHARRDHGGLIFIDLRDRWGITQLVFNPQVTNDAWKVAEKLRNEDVVRVTGTVQKRPEAMINTDIATGTIEVSVTTIDIMSKAQDLPFSINNDTDVNEEVRLKYRYLDLRRPRLQDILKRRNEFITYLRTFLNSRQFIEVQTPILTSSSPEGARDYLVPSRIHPGKFYALPQAPQQYKQLLMVAGLERYFQIAPCFRDEDPRADRHPGEFYQLDMEMSFVTQEDIFALMEELWVEVTKRFSSKTVMQTPFPQIPWKQAMTQYGSDKPDLRFDLHITDVSSIVSKTAFQVFTKSIASGGVVHALHVPQGASLSRSDIAAFETKAKEFGMGGLAYILWKDEPVSPILKFLDADSITALAKATGAQNGDAVFFGAGSWLSVCKALGAVRLQAAEHFNLRDPSKAAWCWVTDFPMYEWNETDKKIDFSHNPFSMPQGGMEALEAKDPQDILAYQYDTVLNGFEVSSGAIRNHDPKIMYKAFALAGYSKEEVDQKFSGMIQAFQYGAPPHGGNAPGIDRIMMVLWDLLNIRDIYAFPKNGRAQDAMMGAPSEVNPDQLKDLHIRIVPAPK